MCCRLGVLVEVNCETDFVARGPQFKELVQDMAMQIAASAGVDTVAVEDAPQEELERERAIEMQKEDIQSKPENIRSASRSGSGHAALVDMPLLPCRTGRPLERLQKEASCAQLLQWRQLTSLLLYITQHGLR